MPSTLLDTLAANDAKAAAELLAACPTLALPAGASRSRSSLSDAALLVVEEGLVLVRHPGSASQRGIVTSEGAAGAILLAPRQDEVLNALMDSSLTAISDEVRDLLLSLPGVGRVLLEGLEANLRQTRETIRNFASVRHVDRVRQKLLQLAREHGRVARDGVRLDFPVTHELLGEMVGSARETMTRAFDELQREGFIVREGRSYRIVVPPEALVS